MVMSFVVSFTHLVFLFPERSAEGSSTKGFGTPSRGVSFSHLTLTARVSKQPDGRSVEEGGFTASETKMSTGAIGGIEKSIEKDGCGSNEGDGGCSRIKCAGYLVKEEGHPKQLNQSRATRSEEAQSNAQRKRPLVMIRVVPDQEIEER